MKLFRDLTPAEELDFRAWARANYVPGTETDETMSVWHPVVRDEIAKMVHEGHDEQPEPDTCSHCREALNQFLRFGQ